MSGSNVGLDSITRDAAIAPPMVTPQQGFIMGIAPDKRRGPGRPTTPVQRTDLIALAVNSFARLGYAGTSMGNLATSAGLSKASLFHHFPTKRGLYSGAVAGIVDELAKLVRQAGWSSTDYAQALDDLGTMVIDYLGSNPLAAKLLVREMIDDGSYMQGQGETAVSATLEATRAFLSAGMDAGAFRRQEPRQLTLTIVGLHLFYFAASNVSTRFLGNDSDVFAPEMLASRKAALLQHVRSLCLANP